MALLSKHEISKQNNSRSLRTGKKPKGNITKKNKKLSDSDLRNGIAKLVLIIVKVLIDLLERQAERKVVAGSLKPEETERLGSAFINIRQTFHDVITKFGFNYKELDMPITSIESRTTNTNNSDSEQLLSAPVLVDILDKLINKETVVAGQIVISVANINLIVLNLLATLLSSKN